MRSFRSSFVVVTVLLGIGALAGPAAAQSKPTLSPNGATLNVSPAASARARTHVLRPPNVTTATSKEERTQLTGASLIPTRKITIKPGPAKPKLNVTKFGEEMHAALKDNVRGYALQMRKGGNPVYTLIWEWSRSPTQGAKGWSLDTRMHVASVSKLITAMAAVKMLDERNLPFDTQIGGYLPTYWTVGNNSADITFRELLTHRAGFTDTYYDGDYGTFKAQIAAGVAANPSPNYTNGSFSLVRVLNATMTGAVPKNAATPFFTGAAKDQLWDMLATDAFENYVKNKVFTPSGVSGIATTGSSTSALAYSTKGDNSGWDSGDLATQLGGAGFRVSVNDMLDVMNTFRRKGTIVSPTKAQEALDASLGIDRIDDLPSGKMYLKNGWWGGGGQDGTSWHVEQAVAAFLPDDMECVVLVNSNIGTSGASLTNTFRTAVANNIE